MHLDGPFANTHLCRGFFVHETRRDQCEHLALADRQIFEAPFKIEAFSILDTCRTRAAHSTIYRSQKRFFVQRLGEDIDSPRPHRLHSDRQIIEARNEDDRCEVATLAKSLLKLQAIHSWQKYVGYDAVKVAGVFICKKLVSGRIERYVEPCRT